MKKGVLIVECLDDRDPGSEGRMLREVMRLMGIPVELVRIESIEDLIAEIAESKYRYVHISTHGVVRGSQSFKGWWTTRGIGSKDAFTKHAGTFAGKSLVSTACRSGVSGFGSYVVETLGARHYIGPVGSPSFHNAALFSHIFYFNLFRTKGTVVRAYQSYTEVYKNPNKFKLFEEYSG